MSLKVAIRADASVEQGTGHLMRCLVIADALRERGHKCIFVTQPFLPKLIKQIKDRKHRVVILNNDAPHPEGSVVCDEYLKWLGRSVARDAFETFSVINREKPDVIIADHYAIDATWMKHVASNDLKKVIIDDLANREHFCDILIDQNFGRIPQHYDQLVPKETTILAGSEYVFIKEDFKKNREKMQADRLERDPRHLNICMGGVDKENSSFRILETIMKLEYFKNWSVDVVLRSSSPNAKMLNQYVENHPRNVKVYFDYDNMASLFGKADLAIGAGGVTLWERCCVGLPTLLLTIADNQVPAALAMSKTGAIVYSGDIREKNWQTKLGSNLSMISTKLDIIHQMSRKAFCICDGNGLGKVCDIIEHV